MCECVSPSTRRPSAAKWAVLPDPDRRCHLPPHSWRMIHPGGATEATLLRFPTSATIVECWDTEKSTVGVEEGVPTTRPTTSDCCGLAASQGLLEVSENEAAVPQVVGVGPADGSEDEDAADPKTTMDKGENNMAELLLPRTRMWPT